MFTSMQIRLERAGHCQKCEYYRRTTKQCTKCGCLINLKVTIAKEECPIGTWKEAPTGTDFMSNIATQIHTFLNTKK